MKTLILTATLATFALSFAGVANAGVDAAGAYSVEDLRSTSVEKRKKKRVKGGSGCDSAHDVAEHPECR
jgi:FlaG/FlaF family flagellin (archaellin)